MAFELWVKARDPMVTFFKTLDVTNLLTVSKNKKMPGGMSGCCDRLDLQTLLQFNGISVFENSVNMRGFACQMIKVRDRPFFELQIYILNPALFSLIICCRSRFGRTAPPVSSARLSLSSAHHR